MDKEKSFKAATKGALELFFEKEFYGLYIQGLIGNDLAESPVIVRMLMRSLKCCLVGLRP
jgi:hypothetical protein